MEEKLQLLHSAAATLLSCVRPSFHSLQVKLRTEFEILLITCEADAPGYINELLTPFFSSGRTLAYSSLTLPRGQSEEVVAHRRVNILPTDITAVEGTLFIYLFVCLLRDT